MQSINALAHYWRISQGGRAVLKLSGIQILVAAYQTSIENKYIQIITAVGYQCMTCYRILNWTNDWTPGKEAIRGKKQTLQKTNAIVGKLVAYNSGQETSEYDTSNFLAWKQQLIIFGRHS